jgi:3-phosphoshikimate 1-carboxyvinyltransferase
MNPLWPAPLARRPVQATVQVPGSKSLTNRALVLGAIGQHPARLGRPLRSRDTELMASALRSLGVTVEEQNGDWVVTPGELTGPATVDVGNAGTVMRFLPPLATVVAGDVHFNGDRRSHERPLAPVIESLRTLGADISSASGGLPMTVHGRGWLMGGTVVLDASQSSQFISALLLAAPRFADGVNVCHRGERVPSSLHIAMTVEMLRRAGAIVEHVDADTWRVEPGPVDLGDLDVEPDLSNAAPFLAAAMVTAGRVTVPDWPVQTTQAGDALRWILELFGARCELSPAGLTVVGPDRLAGVDLDLGDVGELAPVLAAVCALADSRSRLRGIAHLRHHETDRLAALARELGSLGGDVRETPDGLVIQPAPLRGGPFATYEDHRLATAAAVIGLCVPGVEVENVATTAKTLPGFVDLWTGMLE